MFAPCGDDAAGCGHSALLGEWGCDAELWKAVVSKSALIKLVEKGSEEYGRKRIARMRELVAAGGDDA